ncbi:hypothetical protein ACOCJ5_04975 [Knoellia sp. CPCC 206450]|uniref:hypothetical protein n=1 Tax=Knoellia tibetensis TaxID=3404798 RepID=UPI003B42D8F8
MIILGLILVLLAIAAGILLFEGTRQLTDGVDIDVLNGTVSLPPLALLITGAAVITIFWLGWALMRGGIRRSSRRRREAKEQAALAEQRRVDDERRVQEEFAQRERQLAEERDRREHETAALRRDADARVEEQHLSTEEARRRAEIAEAQNAERSGLHRADVDRSGADRSDVQRSDVEPTRETPREPRA